MHELTKREKKIARTCIDKGLEVEFRTTLEQVNEILEDWKKGNLDNKTAYHNVFSKISDKDEQIAHRYDRLTGSRYLLTVGEIYVDGQITEEDIKDFSEETKNLLRYWLEKNKTQ